MIQMKQFTDWYLHIINNLPDRRVNGWTLFDSPSNICVLLITYFLFAVYLGPKYMHNKKPKSLQLPKIIYNGTQVFILCWMLYTITPSILKLNVLCSPVDYSNKPHALTLLNCTWYFFILKLINLIDTVFMVLKKNNRQVRFIHVNQSITSVAQFWIAVKYYGGGHASFLLYTNLIVNTLIYSYYFLASFERFRSNLWWKKNINQIQLIQHTLLVAIYLPAYLNSSCTFPKIVSLYLIIINLLMIILNGNFYYKTYIKKKQRML